ncbi:MAG TPA: hypothetical protein VJR89_43360 [Polyangiales bacterium]|nr:hypothetical protein [Polyangiales bacterium]
MSERWIQHSQALLEASVLIARVDPNAVRRRLERQSLEPFVEHTAGHPLLIELWQVQRGQLALGGAALEELGQACGPWLGAATRALVDRFGSYCEILFSVPDVRVPDFSEPCQLVLGMYTDSALSQRGASWLRYGYGKELASIERCEFATFTVQAGRSRLRARFAPAASGLHSPPLYLRQWLTQPLLGLHDGVRSLSRLSRDFDRAQVVPARGTFSIEDSRLEDLLAGEHAVRGFDEGAGLLGFHAACLPVQLSFPRSIARCA